MKILIIDDHPLYIDGLKTFLGGLFSGAVVYEAETFEAAIELIEAHQFELVLIDFKLSDVSGLDLLQAFLARGVTTPLVIISGEDDPSLAKNALDLGASGFFNKALTPEQLKNAIEVVLNGGEYLSEGMRRQVDRLQLIELSEYSAERQQPALNVTPRQLDVLKLIAKGYTNKRISQVLDISPETVKEHVRNIFTLVGAENRMTCISRAKALGLKLED